MGEAARVAAHDRLSGPATPDGVPALLAALDDRGLAAVGIKLNRYLDALPDQALAVADDRGLPLVQLPDGRRVRRHPQPGAHRGAQPPGALLERSEEVHQALVAVVLDGGGLDELVARWRASSAGRSLSRPRTAGCWPRAVTPAS